MANAWKIGRELRRLRQQSEALLEAIIEPFRQARYDRNRLAHLHWSAGQVPLRRKIALLMIYQPVGLRPSILATCAHLANEGYAPFVVSNGALTAADRQALHAVCWRAGERPNYGYDFGAYRDGILALKDWGLEPETLIVMNDSIWFPLDPGCDLVARLEANPAALAGTILRRRVRSWRPFREPAEVRFLESYCYRIAGGLFVAPAFTAFWRGYRMTDNKYKVIRRGERDFSMAVASAGFAVAAVLTEDAFLRAVGGMDAEGLRRTVLYGAHADDRIAADRLAVLQRYTPSADWQTEALEHVRQALAKGVFNSAFCYPTLGVMNAGYVKKSGERINRLWRARYIEAVTAGDLPPPLPAVRAEIAAQR